MREIIKHHEIEVLRFLIFDLFREAVGTQYGNDL